MKNLNDKICNNCRFFNKDYFCGLYEDSWLIGKCFKDSRERIQHASDYCPEFEGHTFWGDEEI